jgi:hypothetical protein
MLVKQLEEMPNVEIRTNAMVLGRYEDGALTVEENEDFKVIYPRNPSLLPVPAKKC